MEFSCSLVNRAAATLTSTGRPIHIREQRILLYANVILYNGLQLLVLQTLLEEY